MMRLRNSVKAVIIQDGKMLFTKNYAKESGEVFYILPGGGQEPGETFAQTAKRECVEELGIDIDVGDIVLVREYIGKNHEFAYKHANVHQIEYMFRCTPLTPVGALEASHEDPGQIGYEWIALVDLRDSNLYPKVLRTAFDEEGRVVTPVYLGDVN